MGVCVTPLGREIWTEGPPTSGRAVWRAHWAGYGLFCCLHVTPISERLFSLPLHPHCTRHQRDGLPGEGTAGVAMSARTQGAPRDVRLALGNMVTHEILERINDLGYHRIEGT